MIEDFKSDLDKINENFFTKSDGKSILSEINKITEQIELQKEKHDYQTICFPVAGICFLKNTPVYTNKGFVEIGDLDINEHTINNKKICAVSITTTKQEKLVSISKNAFGNNIPFKRTVLTQHHLVNQNGKFTEAKNLVGTMKGVHYIDYDGQLLYNILLDEHMAINVNNLIVETLNPKSSISKLYRDYKFHLMNKKEKLKFIDYYKHIRGFGR